MVGELGINIARVRNCPVVTISNSLFGFCLLVFLSSLSLLSLLSSTVVVVFVVDVLVLGREIEGDVREGHRACLR